MDITMIDEAEDVILLYTNTLNLGNDEQAADKGLILYPNPFEDEVNISGTTTFPLEFRLYDLQGRLVFTEVITSAKTIQLQNTIVTGFYIAEIRQENQVSRTSLLKSQRY
jgi:hypothetical protein